MTAPTQGNDTRTAHPTTITVIIPVPVRCVSTSMNVRTLMLEVETRRQRCEAEATINAWVDVSSPPLFHWLGREAE